jgi:hypothetical protein
MSDLANIIAGGIQDTQSIKPEFGMGYTAGSIVPFFNIYTSETLSLTIPTGSVKLNTRTLGSSFLLGHPSHGWLGYSAASVAVGSQPYLGTSYGAWTYATSGDTMVVTNDGKRVLVNLLGGNINAYPRYMAMGSDATTPTVTDTVLGSEFGDTRIGLNSFTSGDFYAELEMIVPSMQPPTQPAVFREIGVFTDSPTGSMMMRTVFPDFTKTQDIELQNLVTFKIV